MGRKRQKNHPNQKDNITTEPILEESSTSNAEAQSEEYTAVEEGVGESDALAEDLDRMTAAEDSYSEESMLYEGLAAEDAYAEAEAGYAAEEAYAAENEAYASEEDYVSELGEETAEPVDEDLIFSSIDEDEASDKEKESAARSKTEGDESLRSFVGEMGGNLGVWIRKNRNFCIFTVLAVIVCIVVIVAAGKMNKRPTPQLPIVSGNTAAGTTDTQGNSIPLPPDPLAEDAIPEVNALIEQYFTAMETGDLDTFLSIRSYTDSVEKAKFEAKCEYIESYQNIHCYTKPGPYEASYMVYVTYDLKIKDWETPAPALVTLVVCTDQENHLYIYSGGFDENIVDYIRGVTSQEDVYALITSVQTEYQTVVDSDAAFAEYMSVLNQMIKDGVGLRLAAAAEAGIQPDDDVSVSESTATDTSSGEAVSENTAGEDTGDTSSTSFQVRTTSTVNVRMSDSENADKIGRAETGMELTCLEQMQNGWSKILFEGQTGYIKTDYLVAVGTQADTGEQTSVVGKAIVMQSVNIRGSADMEGNVLGKAYPGTSFDVIAKDWNGWTTILYNGKTAYIRTEYIEFKAN